MALFILLKRKNSKVWVGAIPAKKGASRASLNALIRKTLSARYNAKVITGVQMMALVRRGKLRLVRKKSSVKRKVSKKKRVVKRKRVSKKKR